MPEFAYTARDLQGQKVTGTVSANTEREALGVLSGQSLFPVEVAEEKRQTSFQIGSRRIGGNKMAATYSQLASLMRSGVPLLRSVAIIREQTSHLRLKDVLSDVHRRVEDGSTLAEAMGRHPRVFSEMATNMVRAGGEGGFLEEALDRIAQFTEQQTDLKGRTIGALAYPMILAAAATIVVVVLLVFFVPMFGELFDGLRKRGELPVMTDWLLWFSDAIWAWGWLILLILAGLGTLLWLRLSTDEGKRWKDRMKLRVPVAGAIFQNLAVARFCRVLGTMLHNGVPILRSLEISREAAGNRVLSEAIEDASENVTAGASLAEPLSKSGHFPSAVVEMIAVAEESNTLDTVLVQVAEDMEKRTFRRLDLLVRLIEPVMLLFMAGVVACIAIALLLPVLKMGTTME
ncbi:MAG: type II secretion system F family protein [Planctomycetes bacterium]|nr:type II secretion system F family protein [Planctomycetota bacterium]